MHNGKLKRRARNACRSSSVHVGCAYLVLQPGQSTNPQVLPTRSSLVRLILFHGFLHLSNLFLVKCTEHQLPGQASSRDCCHQLANNDHVCLKACTEINWTELSWTEISVQLRLTTEQSNEAEPNWNASSVALQGLYKVNKLAVQISSFCVMYTVSSVQFISFALHVP